MATTYLTRTSWGTATNRQKFTQSFWIKRSAIGVQQALLGVESGGNDEARVLFRTDDTFEFYDYQSGYTFRYITNRKFRDCSAWYNIVLRVDTDNGTAANRVRIYINGVQETSFSTGTQPSRNLNTFYNSSGNHIVQIGRQSTGNSYFTGSMSHVNFLDGEDRDGSFFGSTDATTGEWKIKTTPSGVNYGTNGYFILKNGNSVTDSSTNSNNFTVGGGTLTKTEDNPSNVFCTWNTNYRGTRKDMTLTNGATFIFEQNSGDSSVSGTIAVSGSGKYYWEQRIAQVNGTNAAVAGAMHSTEDWSTTPDEVSGNNNTFGVRSNGNAYKNGTNLGSVTAATYNNDILGIGFDVDNARVFLWRNGVAQNSGNAIITGIDTSKNWIPFGIQHGGARVTTSTNFGNGYFQTTAVSSAGTNASGNGIFEYNVPSGYTAISTKGLNL